MTKVIDNLVPGIYIFNEGPGFYLKHINWISD